RPVQFALAASALALEDAGLVGARVDPRRIGVWAGTSIGNMAAAIRTYAGWASNGGHPAPDAAFRLFHHSAACLVSALFDLRGPAQTVSTGATRGSTRRARRCG
ncbi:MAG TPA: beta-ketoacyl synthase N-terminal-like domain-containing protein, partial [Gemmatimonadota bacterium]|nr:beta-ketoacyl synthase N-terminal-like domain-containing protein [Gemmatimonadota bacterium]